MPEAAQSSRNRITPEGIRLRQAGVMRIELPTPFSFGSSNAYLIEDEPLTLIDTGLGTAATLAELERGLERAGHAVSDIGLVVLTHQHADHVGLAAAITERSEAAIACLDEMGDYLLHWRHAAHQDDELALEVMAKHDAPAQEKAAFRALSRFTREMAHPAPATMPLADGETLQLEGRGLRALHRPGHSAADIVLVDERHELLITGDHLIAGAPSSVPISRPLDGSDGAGSESAFLRYRRSLEATTKLGDGLLSLPGHGPVFDRPAGTARAHLQTQQQHADALLAELRLRGPRGAYALKRRVRPRLGTAQPFAHLCATLGALDLLIESGVAREHRIDGAVRFEAV